MPAPYPSIPQLADAYDAPAWVVRDPAANPVFWIGVEGLVWWTKSQPVPTFLVTTGPASQGASTGNLGQPGTTSLNGSHDLGAEGGVRFFAGGWFNAGHTFGIDGSLFDLPPDHLPLRRAAAILSRVRSAMSSRSNWANDNNTFKTSRPIDVAELKCCVTLTKATGCCSNASISLAKSSNDRLSRSTRWVTTQSTCPDWMSARRRCRAGRSRVLHDSLRDVALAKLEGYTNKEIGERLKLAEPTIERKLGRIRKIWGEETNR
jgi:DNA-binding CsgD family transcriptional regulator